MAFKVNNDFMKSFLAEQEAKEKQASKDVEDTKDAKDAKVSQDTKASKARKGAQVRKDTQVHEDMEDNDVPPAKNKRKSSSTADNYEPEVVREMETKDNGRGYKEFLEVAVKRFGDDGIPYVHFSTRVESDVYTGYKKGKHVSFPLELLYDFLDLVNEVDDECTKKHIE